MVSCALLSGIRRRGAVAGLLWIAGFGVGMSIHMGAIHMGSVGFACTVVP